MIERRGYYMYDEQVFQIVRLVEAGMAKGFTETQTRQFVRQCRTAWNGDETCEDFWNVYRCYHGSV